MDKEIEFFTESIKAFEPAPTDNNYSLFRSLFKRENYFILGDRFVIIKISRSPRPFWGVGRKFIEFFTTLKVDYLLVLLVSEYSGWVFDKQEVTYHIEKGDWKLRSKDDNYKINSPLKDDNSFATPKHFLNKIEKKSTQRIRASM